jgi:general secretion pathway protein L
MSTLIVTLPNEPADAAALYDYVLTPDGTLLGEQSRAPLALLPNGTKDDAEVVALVAAQHLSWHQVQLPKGTLNKGFFQEVGALRVRAVLEGLLEDRLLDDTQQLHFALEPAPLADAPIWVAVCDLVWLRAALQALELAGRPVSRIVPEFTPEALVDTLYVLGQPEDAQMVFAERGGIAVWPLSAATLALLNWPEGNTVVAEPAVVALAEQLFKRTVTLEPGAQRQLRAAASNWDLAQFELVNSNRARAWKRWSELLGSFAKAPRWRAARVALLATLVINVAGLNAWAWKEQAAIKAQRQAIDAVLTSTFPKVQVVVDAQVQMGKEVAALVQASGVPSSRDLDRMLGAFGSVAPAATLPTAIEFVAGEVRLKGLKLQAQDITSFSFKLKPLGYALSAEGDTVLMQQVSGL